MAVRSPSAPDEPLEQRRLRPRWLRKEQDERAGAAMKWRFEVASRSSPPQGPGCGCQYPAVLAHFALRRIPCTLRGTC